MSTPFFTDRQAFAQTFDAGLFRLLDNADLAAFVLVCANALYRPEFHARARGLLAERYQTLLDETRAALAAGHEPAGAADDVSVFLRMVCVGLEGLSPAESRPLGPWELQFNLLRAFRPARMSGAAVSGISRPFDAQKFHFDKPFLLKEAIWDGAVGQTGITLLYNKFPFAPFHGLVVPDRAAHHPQLLQEQYHRFVWDWASELAAGFPGIGFGYNSYGAYASVNHRQRLLAQEAQAVQVVARR